jgi:hypothetical protein
MCRFWKLVVALCLAVMASILPAYARQVTYFSNEVIVSRQGPYISLRNAIADAGPGGTVRIREGRYAATDLQIPHDLTLIGEGNVIITSMRPVQKGLLVPLRGVSLEVRGITFQNATSPDQNGAGIRLEGRELIVHACTFVNNENGILATGEGGSEVTILDSTFLGNGYGDGYSHGIYMSQGAKMLIEGSRFEGTRIGHHVKSIASESTIVRNSTFIDGNGQPSYVVDVTGGGDMTVERNTITRARSAEQQTLLNYDTTRSGRAGTITIQFNQINNEKPNAKLLRNQENARVVLKGNSFNNLNGGTLELPDTSAALTDESLSNFPVVEEKTIIDAVNLEGLSPQQRRSVERMIAQGAVTAPVKEAPAPLVVQPSIRQAPSQQPAQQVPIASRSPDALVSVEEPAPRSARPKASTPAVQDVTIIKAPSFQQPQQIEDIVGLRFERLNNPRATSNLVTFGHVFTKGALHKDTPLSLRVSDRLIAVQTDIKATHTDGSVRHAVLTVDLREVAQRRTIDAMLTRKRAIASQQTQPSLANQPYGLELAISGRYVDGSEFAGMVDLRTLALNAFAEGRYWLVGDNAVETSVSKNIGRLLTVRADIRVLKDNSIRTNLVFENHRTFAVGNRDITYSVIAKDGPHTVLQETDITQYRGSNWSRVIWRGRKSAWHVQLDPAYMIRAGAVPPFNLADGILEKDIEQDLAAQEASTGLFDAGLMTKYFPTTGARSDIGILTDWDVTWLKTQDQRAFTTMVRQARRAGAVPWHFEDDGSGAPVRLDERPRFWAEERGTAEEYGRSAIPRSYFEGSDGGWTTDAAHKPSATFLAYLATGDAYFARELAYETSYTMAATWPEEREPSSNAQKELQLRSRAWILRDTGNAAWALPDQEPLKAYFTDALRKYLTDLYTVYIEQNAMGAAGETEGWFQEYIGADPARISPWQNDFMVMVLGQEARRGSIEAAELVDWAANYHIDRFLHPDSDPSLGVAAAHVAKDPSSLQPIATWRQLMAATASRDDARQNYAHFGGGYVISAKAALATIYEVTGNRQALVAIQALDKAVDSTLLYDPENDGSVYSVANFHYAIPQLE